MGMMVLKLTLEIFAFALWRSHYWLMGFLLSRGSSCGGEAAELEKSEKEAGREFQTVSFRGWRYYWIEINGASLQMD